jgi:shikimate kinase
MKGRRNVFLIGPMGAGKSTIGRHLSTLLKLRFLDADHEIEARTGVSIPLIFDIEGEPGFRRREAAVIDELTRQQSVVLATGGGAILDEAIRAALKERGIVVYLRAGVDILVERTRRDRNRPLLQTADPRARIEELLARRGPLYEATADIIVDTDQRSPLTVAREVAAKVNEFRNHEDADT